MAHIAKTWTSAGLICKAWKERDLVWRGAIFAHNEAVRCAEFLQRPEQRDMEALDALVASIDALAALEAKPRGLFDITDIPITDLVLRLQPPRGVPDHEKLQAPVSIAPDVEVIPASWGLARVVMQACDPPGINRSRAIDLRAPLYAFVRHSAPREPLYSWDSDDRLRMILALSRL